MRARSALGLAAAALLAGWGVAVARHAHFTAPPPTPIAYDRDGRFLAQYGHVDGSRTEYGYWRTAPPEEVVRATIALEDRRFRHHPGVDPAAVLRALWQHATGSGRSGASTIAMQVARLQNPRPRTLWAKAVEAGTAIALTLRYGRDAVLAQYFVLAPYGNGSHGIGHAARLYFDKPAADLSPAESALLAAVPRAPGRLNPLRPDGLAAAKRRAAAALAAGDLPRLAALRPLPAPRRPDALLAIARLGAALPAPAPDDPRLRTTLDLAVQAQVAAMLRAQLAQWRAAGAQQAAAMVVRRQGREVLASVGAAAPRLPGGAIDFTRARRSPGSTLKPFLYALALERGVLGADEVVQDVPDGAAGIANADGAFLGRMLPRQALANSRNVPAVAVLRRLGLAAGFEALRDLGLHDSPGPPEHYGLSLAIGTLPSSLERLMTAYAALADGGMGGDLAWWRGPPPTRARLLREDTARLVTQFLADPMARLPSFPRYGEGEYPFAVAIKTGTSQGWRDAWTLAWSRDYLVGVWVGRADAQPMHGLSGARAAGRIANALLLALHGATRGDLTAGDFPAPAGREARELCTLNGRSGQPCAASLIEWIAPSAPPPAPVATLAITAPEANARLWRNPEAPPAANRLALRVAAAGVAQVVWLVDGTPVGTADPARPFYWPMTPGAHRVQVRLPFAAAEGPGVRFVVE